MRKKKAVKKSELICAISESIFEALSQECSNVEIIGKFICDDEMPINELAQIGKFKSVRGTYTVTVWSDDSGKIPHVHITSTNGFDGCVKLGINEPFPHGSHTDILNSRQRKAFAKFMGTAVMEDDGEKLNYTIAINAWNRNNSDVEIHTEKDDNGNVIIPDYRNM